MQLFERPTKQIENIQPQILLILFSHRVAQLIEAANFAHIQQRFCKQASASVYDLDRCAQRTMQPIETLKAHECRWHFGLASGGGLVYSLDNDGAQLCSPFFEIGAALALSKYSLVVDHETLVILDHRLHVGAISFCKLGVEIKRNSRILNSKHFAIKSVKFAASISS